MLKPTKLNKIGSPIISKSLDKEFLSIINDSWEIPDTIEENKILIRIFFKLQNFIF